MKRRFTTALAVIALSGVALVGCAGDNDDADDLDDPGMEQPDPAPTDDSDDDDSGDSDDSSGGSLGESADLSKTELPISQKAAVDAADAVAPGSTVTKIEVDYSRPHAAWVWEIDLQDGSEQHEVTISADSGDVLESKSDTENDPAESVEPASLSAADAMVAAQKVKSGTVSGWTLERDDAELIYEVDIRSGNDDETVIVNANTGDAVLDD